MEVVIARISTFLREIGIPVTAAALPESFLPGIAIERGGLLVDEARLEYPGDLLHEAGHIAMARPDVRSGLSGDIDDMPDLEWAAIPWSYAAALEAGIDPALVFHGGGYRGHSAGLLQNFVIGVPIGLHLLVEAGMTSAELYPQMLRWLRA
jgi:hypothetical protein